MKFSGSILVLLNLSLLLGKPVKKHVNPEGINYRSIPEDDPGSEFLSPVPEYKAGPCSVNVDFAVCADFSNINQCIDGNWSSSPCEQGKICQITSFGHRCS
ncbi:hypothetical protein K502DRAFT_325495 [Neoconidiobolus thromboides FSU 785]|nr:hypothetical protein K502DRAFT_325495 [Neoconidiobolus thromboides FSU 785]